MKYQVYENLFPSVDENAKLIESNLTEEKAQKLLKENPNYCMIPQFINGG